MLDSFIKIFKKKGEMEMYTVFLHLQAEKDPS